MNPKKIFSVLYCSKHIVVSVATAIVFINSGCDNTSPVAVTDSAIYSEFSVVYNATENLTTAKAVFWKENKNNVQVIFNPDAELTFQNIPLEYQSQGAFYTKQLNGFAAECEFRVVDINKKSFTNSITANFVMFPNTADTITTSLPYHFTWIGIPLEKNEYVVFHIADLNIQQDTTGASKIVLTSANRNFLSSYKNQTVEGYMVRYKTVTPLQQSLGAGGIISSQYSSLKKMFYIK